MYEHMTQACPDNRDDPAHWRLAAQYFWGSAAQYRVLGLMPSSSQAVGLNTGTQEAAWAHNNMARSNELAEICESYANAMLFYLSR